MAPCAKLLDMMTAAGVQDKSVRSLNEVVAKAKENTLPGVAGMLHARVGPNGVVYVPAGFYVWALASPEAASSKKACFGWRCNLAPTKAGGETTAQQKKNLEAAAEMSTAEKKKLDNIAVKTPKVTRKIKQFQVDLGVISSAMEVMGGDSGAAAVAAAAT
eukprot:5871502-Alexandrium_andersonii.AAC.1